MKIRFANQSDKEQVMKLILELQNVGNKIQGKPHILLNDLPSDIYNVLLKRKYVKIFVAEEENHIVGLTTLYVIDVLRRKKQRAELEELVVTKDMRGKGIGEKLINAALEYCKKNNIYALKLSTLLGNKRAHVFYRKQGGKIKETEFRFEIDS